MNIPNLSNIHIDAPKRQRDDRSHSSFELVYNKEAQTLVLRQLNGKIGPAYAAFIEHLDRICNTEGRLLADLTRVWSGIDATTARKSVFDVSFDDWDVDEDIVRILSIEVDKLIIDNNGFMMEFNVKCIVTDTITINLVFDQQILDAIAPLGAPAQDIVGYRLKIATYVEESSAIWLGGTAIEGRSIKFRYVTSDHQSVFEETYPGGSLSVTFGDVMKDADDEEGTFHIDIV